jgi:hypothetical protein
MQVTTQPECPEYFRFSKSNCTCVLRPEHMDKIDKIRRGKKRTEKKKPRRSLSDIDFHPGVTRKRSRCPRGMFYDKHAEQCELNELKSARMREERERKRAAARERREANRPVARPPKPAKVSRPKTLASQRSSKLSDSLLRKLFPDKKKRTRKTMKERISSKFHMSPVRTLRTTRDTVMAEIGDAITPVHPETASRRVNFVTQQEISAAIDSLSAQPSSFSPAANRQITRIRETQDSAVDECGSLDKSGAPKVKVDGKCVLFSKPEAQRFMLSKLGARSSIDCKKIVAPKQLLSNCWFNAMFMAFFVSDKGRKFFQAFRALMIEGKHMNGESISVKLHAAFFRLNLAIEACLGSSTDPNLRDIALRMDTNTIIQKIYNAIPSQFRNRTDIKRKGVAGNPILYYQGIINFLGNESVSMMIVESHNYRAGSGKDWRAYAESKLMEQKGPLPDIVVLEFMDEESRDRPFGKDEKSNKPADFLLTDGERSGEYRLDSAIVRDNRKKHFCSLITCSREQFGFDGMSFSRLTPFKWKGLINSHRSWTFSGSSDDGSPLKWSFRDGYQLLLYFRHR